MIRLTDLTRPERDVVPRDPGHLASYHRVMKGILVLVLTALVLAACGTATPTTEPTTQPTPTAEPTTDPTTRPTPIAEPTMGPMPTVVFEPADVPDPATNTAVSAVVPGGDGLVALVTDGAYGTRVWTSADGTAWRDVTPSGFEGIGLAGATVHDGRIVAVGRGDTINIEAERAIALVSEDGLTWREATAADENTLTGQLITVRSTADGLVAVGGVPGADAAGFWRSDDGEAWERVGDDIPGAFLWTLADAGPDAGLVAVGWRRDPEPSTAVWRSTDGSTWELAADPEGYAGFEGTGITVAPSGTLVMTGGNVFGGEGRIWRSTDAGATWTVAEVDGGLVESTTRSVVSTPIGLVAVGAIGMDGAAWISTDDGATWQPFGEPVPEAYFHDALVTETGLVLLGATQTGTVETGIDARAMTWTATLGE